MIVDPQRFEELHYYAERIEEGNQFEQDLGTFVRLADKLKKALSRASDDPKILNYLNRMPEIEPAAHHIFAVGTVPIGDDQAVKTPFIL